MTETNTLEKPDQNHSNNRLMDKKNNWINFEKNEIILLISYFLFGIAFANYEPYAPIWLNQIFQEDSFLIIGFVVVIPSIVGAVGSPLWGLLADKFGAKSFVIIGRIAFSFMFIGLIFIESTTYFLVLILIGYLLGSAQTSNIFVLATKSISKPKEIIFAKLTITVSTAFVIFSPLAGWIYDNFANSMIIQLTIAVCASFLAAVIVFFVKEGSVSDSTEKQEVEPNKKSALTIVPVIFSILMIFTFVFQSGAGFWAYSSIYFLDTLSVKGIYFSIFIIVKTALAVPFSILLGRVKSKKTMGIIISCLTAYFVFVYSLMTIFPTKWILLIIFYSVPMYPLYNVFLYGLTASYSNKSRRALAFGIFNTIGTLGYVSGIIIMGLIADSWTTGKYAEIFSMFPVSIVIASISFLLALFFYFFELRKAENYVTINQNPIEEKNEVT